jgi:hypothetical protein
MNTEFFQGIKQWEMEWQGMKGKLPVFYYDNTSITAIHTASTQKVQNLLPNQDMRPIEFLPGRCLVAFTAFEYRRTDIDPYNEFSIAFLITFRCTQIPMFTAAWQMLKRRFTAYVWQLPVTTEIARAGGVELYGYPKFIADIEFQRKEGSITCNLSEHGKKILSLKGQAPATHRGKEIRYVTYSIKDGIPLLANVVVNPLEFSESRSSQATELILSKEHSISQALMNLDLSAKPIMYQYSPRTEAILFGARNLLDV